MYGVVKEKCVNAQEGGMRDELMKKEGIYKEWVSRGECSKGWGRRALIGASCCGIATIRARTGTADGGRQRGRSVGSRGIGRREAGPNNGHGVPIAGRGREQSVFGRPITNRRSPAHRLTLASGPAEMGRCSGRCTLLTLCALQLVGITFASYRHARSA